MTHLRLIGFSDSVYTRSVRLALYEKGLDYRFEDVNPFTEAGSTALAAYHPFGRVPVLCHGAFELYETAAILEYLDCAFEAPSLTPTGAQPRARMRQAITLTDAYVYWPLVRQVYAQGFYVPASGQSGDAETVRAGLHSAGPILDAIEDIASEGLLLNGRDISQADCHMFAMLDAFACVPDGAVLLKARPCLAQWFKQISARPAALHTRPDVMKGA